MRFIPSVWAAVALAVLIAPGLKAYDDKPDAKKDDAKGKVEGKKDQEEKGKIPDKIRKAIDQSKVTFGVVLLNVQVGGPATNGHEEANGKGDVVALEEGDIITHVNGKEVRTAADYHKLMSGNEERKLTVIDCNTGKPVNDHFTPQDGKLGITFAVITPPVS